MKNKNRKKESINKLKISKIREKTRKFKKIYKKLRKGGKSQEDTNEKVN